MIPKVIPKRGDGKSSFQQLGEYITEGIEQSGGSAERTSWDNLTQYIVKPSVLDELGDDVEKTIAVEVGNCHSLARAPKEMLATAQRSLRAEDPVLHLVLSWPEPERPEAEAIFGAARHMLKSLGLLEHQYIFGIHDNTGNRHCHIEVNRVHPRTFRPARLEWLHKALHRAAREAEIENGWTHDNGLFEVMEINGRKVIVETAERDRRRAGTSQGARRVEAWSGEMSLETWCKGAPAEALRAVMADLTSWQHVHQVLANFSLELRDSGGRGMRVHDISVPTEAESGRGIAVGASKAFRFLKRAELEQRFGAFEAARPAEWQSSEPAAAGYKRDPAKRLERRMERRELRDELHARYKQELVELRERRQATQQALRDEFALDDAARLSAQQAAYRQARAAIGRDPSLTSPQKQVAYMLAKLSAARVRAQLREQLRQERARRRELLPALRSWRAWVEAEALAGDDAAISALRGMVYQDGREAKRGPAADEIEVGSNIGTIAPAKPAYTDPKVRPLGRLTWRVSSHGTVIYSLDPTRTAFIDAGAKLSFGKPVVADDELKVALLYAAEKWGGALRLNGGDQVFRERVTRMAAEMNIQLLDQDLGPAHRHSPVARRAPATQPNRAPVSADGPSELLGREPRTSPADHEDTDRGLQEAFGLDGDLGPHGRRVAGSDGGVKPVPEALDEFLTLSRDVGKLQPSVPAQADSAPLTSLGLARAWIKQQGKKEGAVNTDAGRCTGPILHVTAEHALQDLGRGEVGIHRLADLAMPSTVGQRVTIQYRDGRATVKTLPTKERGRDR